ncbi:hypothetical protein M514_04149 [Trichuris suis]|uniref:C2H2-type domain-containing protein n=1 Tax=Trichuris suis TaxID=68888 RepID=A0A085MCM1_9BILA|nr:hypothetical protein M513_04149 [Trichuris suis]KFD68442.1 hypothetical protein M514_04149 [Trichuris suis]KHJ47665.1 zinc finger, C2H2 type [Trichuris suis]
MESNSTANVSGEEALIFDVDPKRLAGILSGTEPAADFADLHGNTVRITTEQLKQAGLTVEMLEGVEAVQLEEAGSHEANKREFQLVTGNEVTVSQQECDSLVEQTSPSHLTKDTALSKSEDRASLPPALSVSVPVRRGEDLMKEVKLHVIIDEVRRQIQEQEKRIEKMAKQKQLWEMRRRLICAALIKIVSSEDERVIPVYRPDAPDIPVANVVVKRFHTDQPPEDDTTVINVETGERWFVQVKDLTEQRSSCISRNLKGQLVCYMCLRRFFTSEQLKQHQQVVHPHKDAFYCRFCERKVVFTNEARFISHIRLCHKGILECMTAGQEELNSTDEVEEEPDWETIYADGETDEERKHKCTICRKDFPSALLSRKHLQKDHATNDLQRALSLMRPTKTVPCEHRCSQCGKTYSKAQMLEKHSIIHRKPKWGDVPFTCTFCGKTFRWNENLQKHLKTHDNQQSFQCPDCNKTFSSSTRLDVHYKAHHTTAGDHLACKFCPKSFGLSEVLRKHMLSHGQWRCNDCDRRFIDKQFMKHHQSKHSAQDYECDVCEKTFCRPVSLGAHRNLHTGEKPYTCTFCSIRFTSRPNWKAHMRSHMSIKQFACSNCSAAFKVKENFGVHMEVHKPPKPYGCNLCHRSYDRFEFLYVHSVGRRPTGKYSCPKCNKVFFDKKALHQHAQSHEQLNPFLCAICDRSFPTKQRIKAHMISHVDRPELSHFIVVRNSRTDDLVSVTYLESGKQPIEVELPQLDKFTQKIISGTSAAACKIKENVVQPNGGTIQQEVVESKTTEEASVEEPKGDEPKDVAVHSSEPAAEHVACSTEEVVVDTKLATPVLESSGMDVGCVQMGVEIIEETNSSV